MIVTIPFVCKLLEQTTKSRVFRPPNPWLMAILRLLAELYFYADLKLNLKFEIEVMCKNTNIELKDIEPSNVLQINPQPQEDHLMHPVLPQAVTSMVHSLPDRKSIMDLGKGLVVLFGIINFLRLSVDD